MSGREETVRMIAESAAFMASADALERARELRWRGVGFARDLWSRAAELGWLALRVPEECGGVGLGVTELCALAEALGTGLAPEPLVEAICVAPLLSGDLLDQVLSGERIVLPAWQEHDGPVTTFTDRRLHGGKRAVRMGKGADLFAVAVGESVVLVGSDAPGVAITQAQLQDGGHFASLTFDGVPGALLPAPIGDIGEEITLATAAYLLGVMRRAFAITKDYLVTRTQFGQPIGAFQVLQHRMADLYVQIELAAASVSHAAASIDQEAGNSVRLRAVSRAKARASDAAMLVTRQGIQLHGGIGFTDEADIGLFLRKALVLANLYGGSGSHRERYAASLNWDAAETGA